MHGQTLHATNVASNYELKRQARSRPDQPSNGHSCLSKFTVPLYMTAFRCFFENELASRYRRAFVAKTTD